LLYDITCTFAQILKQQYRIQTAGQVSIKDRLNSYISRESDSSIIVHSENFRRIIAVLESTYCESAKINEQEFEEDLEFYFENSDEINLVIGVYVMYIHPSLKKLPDCIPMKIIVLHRKNSIPPQRLSFGQDANHDQPILINIDCRAIFREYQLVDFPESFSKDIRYLMDDILYEIKSLRKE
jgi:hypothetical protein